MIKTKMKLNNNNKKFSSKMKAIRKINRTQKQINNNQMKMKLKMKIKNLN